MDTATLKAKTRKRILDTVDQYVKDLHALPHEALESGNGGASRSPYDMTYEIVQTNKRISCRLRGEDPGPWSFDSWITAPAEVRNLEAIEGALRGSFNEIVAAIDATPDEDFLKTIQLPNGETSPLEMANFAVVHLMYHDGQINYIQAMRGDDKVHW